MKTFASLFSGFGGCDIGAKAAGLQLAWGVEYDAKIAKVANHNLGQHIKVTDILNCDPGSFEQVDVLHASPPCPSFSVAKTNGQETPHDIAMASKVSEFVTVLTPEIFTLENVYAYRNSKSWRIIENALYKAGYWLHIDHVNAADYGVPQTRKRMIVRAIRNGFVPYLPQPVKWVGWYEAIEDLIPTLPDSKFAPWQLERLPKNLYTMLLAQGCYDNKLVESRINEPTFTITANSNQLGIKAFIVSGGNTYTPVLTNEKSFFTLSANEHGSKAFVSCGRVVAMTPHCLARFQSFPDSYKLPESKALAAKGIGNAVPPLMMQRIYEELMT